MVHGHYMDPQLKEGPTMKDIKDFTNEKKWIGAHYQRRI